MTEASLEACVVGERLSPAGGVSVCGIDLGETLRPGLKEALLRALREHHIVAIRDQALSAEQQYAFTSNFGEIEQHVGRHSAAARYQLVHQVANLGDDGMPTTALAAVGNYHWHTDKSYHAVPSFLTMLHAVELPPAGGDTQFANTALAYAALPGAMRQRIAGLRVVHSWAASRKRAGAPPPPEIEMRERPPVEHPLVRTHPDTGAKALYIGNHASHILGLSEADSEMLLEELLAHATQPRFVYTHHWRPGDVVMWDNRCLLHRALANYEMAKHRRVLNRTVVTGTVPF